MFYHAFYVSYGYWVLDYALPYDIPVLRRRTPHGFDFKLSQYYGYSALCISQSAEVLSAMAQDTGTSHLFFVDMHVLSQPRSLLEVALSIHSTERPPSI